MAKLIIKDRKLCTQGGKVILDANGAPCVCDGGGGGGGDCCVCGKCYFDGPDTTINMAMNMTGSGSFVECCRPLGPTTGGCTQNDFSDSINYNNTAFFVGSSGCEVRGNRQQIIETISLDDCDGGSSNYDQIRSVDFQSVTQVSDGMGGSVCPNMILPPSGALVTSEGGDYSDGVMVVWGGATRLSGPIVRVQTFASFGTTLFATNATVYVYYFSDSDGNSSFIALHLLFCASFPCVNGVPSNDIPLKISGGGSISGGFSCGGGFSANGNYTGSYESVCEIGLDQDGNDICLRTGTTFVDINFGVAFSLSSFMQQCPPNPHRGTGSGVGTIGTETIHIPQVFLDSDPILQQAHDAIKSLFQPGAPGITPTPPPGGFPPAEDFLP